MIRFVTRLNPDCDQNWLLEFQLSNLLPRFYIRTRGGVYYKKGNCHFETVCSFCIKFQMCIAIWLLILCTFAKSCLKSAALPGVGRIKLIFLLHNSIVNLINHLHLNWIISTVDRVVSFFRDSFILMIYVFAIAEILSHLWHVIETKYVVKELKKYTVHLQSSYKKQRRSF